MLTDIEYTKLTPLQIQKPQADYYIKPANHFTLKQLTDIYNQTRVDYIVPMPMNEAKLREYVHNYDVDLTQSVVAMSDEHPLGLAMLGIRSDVAWITRLGVTPHGRQKGIGRGLMNSLIDNARQMQAQKVVLEVIKNNKPAQRLFESLGFQVLRELLVVRRPPKAMNMTVKNTLYIETAGFQDAAALLKNRTDAASWVTANESLTKTNGLVALTADIPKVGRGWLVYESSVFQLNRLVLETDPAASTEVATNLLQHLHWRHPVQDTVVENVPANHQLWPVFQSLGYITSFTRVEMELALS